MIKLKINNTELEVAKGTKLIDAAGNLGIKIPTMCYYKELDHFTSCMLCVVKDESSGKLLPACSIKAEAGMDIQTDNNEVKEARKTALELLLSDHVGDCEAPCKIACPAHMDIPKMNRLLASGRISEALAVIREDIALPGILGRICAAPCEAVCHRKSIDAPVAICMLKRFGGDYGDQTAFNAETTNKKAAVIGAGLAGLAAAYRLQTRGIQTTLFEKQNKAGGELWSVDPQQLPADVIEREIDFIVQSGVELKLNQEIDAEQFQTLQNEYDSIIITTGSQAVIHGWGLAFNDNGIVVDRTTFQSSLPTVFAAGSAVKHSRMAIRVLAQGKDAADCVWQLLENGMASGIKGRFNSRIGKLMSSEFQEYLKEANQSMRIKAHGGIQQGYSLEEVKQEAARCMHCDCRKLDNCKLRDYAEEYQADQKKYKLSERNRLEKINQHDLIIYEPEKCIKCGICVRIAEVRKEKLGLTFIGRGFDVKIEVPFEKSLKNGLSVTAEEIVNACPTGAMAMKR